MTTQFTYDPALVAELASSFGLRKANIKALHKLTQRLTTTGEVTAKPLVMDMATGAGKTYVMAAFIEYLRRLGHRNILIVTPGLVVQTKTVANLTRGTAKFIEGAPIDPRVITPDNYKTTHTDQTEFADMGAANVYVFNVQQLIAPKNMDGDTTSGKATATARGIRKFSEYAGVLYDDLAALDDLVVLADEHHLYSASAKAFNAAIRDLQPAVTIGFTASASETDDVVFRYTLKEAIADKSVKQPVIAYRKDGYGDNGQFQQLKDAVTLLDNKAKFYADYAQADSEAAPITPVMLVVCEDIAHAKRVEELLVSPDFFGDPYAVLRVDSDSMTVEKTQLLDNLDLPDSPVRAVVSVNKLKEGWDTRSIAVMVTLRAMDSDILTQQTLGRGLRLPFGAYTEIEAIDTLEIVAHDSFRRLLTSEKVLRSFGVEDVQQALIEKPAKPAEPRVPDTRFDTDSGHEGDTDSLFGEVARDAESKGAEREGEHGTEQRGSDKWRGQTTQPTTQLRELGGDGTEPEKWHDNAPTLAVVEMVEKFRDVSFLFPRTTCMREDSFYPLRKLSTEHVKQAAFAVTDESTAVMERYKLNFRAHTISPERLKQFDIDSLAIDADTVRKELKTMVLRNRLIEANAENIAQLDNRIIKVFMDHAPIDDWTVDAMVTANVALDNLISKEVAAFAASLDPVVKLMPLRLPRAHRTSYMLSPGKTIAPRPDDDTKYVRYQFYSGWNQNLYTASAFDSDSGEAKLACDLDVSPQVEWWTRLYREDEASIAYSVTGTYYPDFVVRDTDGRTWIVEGKDERGRTDETVKRKREAAEEAINLMAGDPQMGELKVGYVIAYEGDIKKAGSWKQLLAIGSPVKSAN